MAASIKTVRLDMPADTDIDDNTPTQSDKIGWRRGRQKTESWRLSTDDLRRYGQKAKVIGDDINAEDVEALANLDARQGLIDG
jgi:hypothetical protein